MKLALTIGINENTGFSRWKAAFCGFLPSVEGLKFLSVRAGILNEVSGKQAHRKRPPLTGESANAGFKQGVTMSKQDFGCLIGTANANSKRFARRTADSVRKGLRRLPLMALAAGLALISTGCRSLMGTPEMTPEQIAELERSVEPKGTETVQSKMFYDAAADLVISSNDGILSSVFITSLKRKYPGLEMLYLKDYDYFGYRFYLLKHEGKAFRLTMRFVTVANNLYRFVSVLKCLDITAEFTSEGK